ncbi:MAG: tail fiber domain-containing protein [Alphaproteobacteria bacterium]|nr:tail fiber domain-containing protein [Alphaproteobacteria bacterium]
MRSYRYAFSLVELSIVLAILGVMTAGGLSIGTTVVEQQANVASNTQLDSINQALQDYFKTQRRLPCPANRTLALGAAGFGNEAGVCNAGAALAGTVSIGGVRIGALPVRALGLRDRSIADEFGNRYIYAVTERHTNDVDFVSTAPVYQGMITLLDGGGNTIAAGGTNSGVSYVIVSTGSDGKGGLRYQTAGAPVACGASTNLDVQNCNDDATFRDARFNNGSVAASFFDDFVRWMPKFRLSAVSTGSSTNLWSNVGDNIHSVGNDGSTTTGNVGIGTTTPTSGRLHVVGSGGGASSAAFQTTGASINFVSFLSAQGGGNYGTSLQFTDTGVNNATISSIADSQLEFSTAGAPRMRITANGNVGIGTTTPGTARLKVEGAVASPSYLSEYSNTGTGRGIYVSSQDFPIIGKSTSNASGNWAVRGESQDGLHYGGLGVANAYGAYGVTYRPGGYIGVYGIADTVATGGYGVYGWGNANNSYGVRGHVPAAVTGALAMLATADGSNNAFLAQQAGSQRYCYIGTASYALQCGTADTNFQGKVGILSGVNAAYGLTVGADVLASGFFSPSDARLKADIHPAFAENALEVLQKIHAVHFTWKKDGSKDIGVIAQDVEKVMPEAVNGKGDQIKQVAYDKLILPVIEAVKQLYTKFLALVDQVRKLETRIDTLEKENQQLKQRLERLEKRVGA